MAAAPADFPSSIPICDPHFHVWDNVKNPKNLNLGGIADGPLGVYLSATYLEAARALPIVAAVHVETVVGQRAGGFAIDTVAETRFVLGDCAPAFGPARALGVSAYVHLGRADAPEVLAAHLEAAQERLVGVRMIQNFDAADASLTWPQVESNDCLAGRVPEFADNLRLLARLGLVFELHANPHQLVDAAALLRSLGPRMPAVVLNHLGCPKLGSGDAAKDAATLAAWRAGIAALAALGPRVSIKISGLEYICAGWLARDSAARETVRGLVFEVLEAFSPSRCMVASNFPVDLAMGGKDIAEVYGGLHELLAGWRPAEASDQGYLRELFHDTAMRVYGLARMQASVAARAAQASGEKLNLGLLKFSGF